MAKAIMYATRKTMNMTASLDDHGSEYEIVWTLHTKNYDAITWNRFLRHHDYGTAVKEFTDMCNESAFNAPVAVA